jgi:hypothetical protein
MRRFALLTTCLLWLWSAPGFSQTAKPVPITDEFSGLELGVTGLNLVAGPFILLAGPRLVTQQPTLIDPPEEGSIDYAVSQVVLHGNLETGERILGGVTDPVLLATPWAGLLFYGVSAGWASLGKPLPGQSVHIAHSAIAYAEALGWTSLLVGGARLLVGRERPWVALDRPQFAREGIEPTTSLASSHTALGATFASFVGLDLSAHLIHRQDAGVFVGRVLPFTILYGFVALASVAHIYDQENFVSDELIGLSIGTAIGAVAWWVHFDARGRPRGRNRRLSVAPLLDESALGVSFGFRLR